MADMGRFDWADPFRLDDQQVALVLEATAIGFQAAVKGIEFGVLVELLSINGCCLGIALPLDLLRIAIGVGNDDFALAIGIGTNLLGFRCSFRT